MSSFFRFRRQRKIHHALIFARKAEKQYSYFSFEERMAVFSACSKAYNPNSNYACDERVKGAVEDYLVNSTVWSLFNSNSQNSVPWEGNNLAKKQQVVWDEDEMIWKKKMSPDERERRRKIAIGILNKRRNAVCSEIEREVHLEQLRHNLQATYELTVRGLLM